MVCNKCGFDLKDQNLCPQCTPNSGPFKPIDDDRGTGEGELTSEFASGLPQWSMEPPDIIVKRKKRRI